MAEAAACPLFESHSFPADCIGQGILCSRRTEILSFPHTAEEKQVFVLPALRPRREEKEIRMQERPRTLYAAFLPSRVCLSAGVLFQAQIESGTLFHTVSVVGDDDQFKIPGVLHADTALGGNGGSHRHFGGVL